MSHTFAALQNRNYRWLLCGNTAQFFAIASRMMVCNFLAWELTQREVSLALINLSLAVPMFTGALIAGTLVDRFERRRLMIFGLCVIVTSEAGVFVALLTDHLQFWQLLAATFLGGCAHPFIHPASTAMMYGLLGRDTMANGVALLSSGMSLSRVLGPAVTGLVLAMLNTTFAYAMVALLFTTALFCVWHLPGSQPVARQQHGVFTEITNGFHYLVKDGDIALCLLFLRSSSISR
jgi:MFS family permease